MATIDQRPDLKQISLIVSLTVAIFLSGVFVFLTPLPLIYLSLKGARVSLRYSLITVFLLLVALYTLLVPTLNGFYAENPQWIWLLPIPAIEFYTSLGSVMTLLAGLSYFVFFMAVSFIVAHLLEKSPATLHDLAVSVMMLIIAIFLLYGLFALFSMEEPWQPLYDYFDHAYQEFLSLQATNQDLPEFQLTFLKEHRAKFVEYSVNLMPAVVVCTVVFIVLLNLIVARRVFFALIPLTAQGAMNRWSYPFFGVWVVIACIALLLVNYYTINLKAFHFVSANLLIVSGFLYLIQGLVIVSYYLQTKQVRPFSRALIYASFLLLFQVAIFLLLGLGFFDSWFDFRRITKAKSGVDNGVDS